MKSRQATGHWFLVGMIPTVLVAALGLQVLRRETVWSRLEARAEAEARAGAMAEGLAERVFGLPLPSYADVQAWRGHPGGPETEPLARLAASHGVEVIRLFAAGGEYPAALPVVTSPEPLLPGSEWARAWAAAAEVETREPAAVATAQAWESVVALTGGMRRESLARFRAGAAYGRCGRTSEAVGYLEPLGVAPSGLAGETGLPLEILALRSLLHLGEVDPTQEPRQAARLDALCERVLVHWRLPDGLLEGLRSIDAPRLEAWRRVAARHEAARRAFPEPTGGDDSRARSMQWQEVEPGQSALELTQPVADGTWRIRWPEAAVRTALAREGQNLGLPAYAAIRVRIGERWVGDGPGAGEILATASASGYPGVSIALMLERPEILDERQRRRTWMFATWVGLATLASGGAFWGLVRTAERHRQLARQQSEFVAAVSHELRAPLSAIRLLAEELLDLPEGEVARRGEYHGLILREARRLGLLVDNVLRRSRAERNGVTLEPVPLDFGEVVGMAVETLRPMAEERGVGLRVSVPEEGAEGVADHHAMTQIVVNLVDNAVKHAPAGSVVEVELRRVVGSVGGVGGGRFRLGVRDRGPGIPAGEQERIFEAFVRRGSELRRETPGVGLGLAIVRQLAEAQGGKVRVESREGSGALFVVELPAVGTTEVNLGGGGEGRSGRGKNLDSRT